MSEAVFVHAADAHLGSQDRAYMKEGEKKAFEDMIDACLRERVDFLIFSGDLFDSNVPSMAVAGFAAQQLKRLKDAGIRAYEVHGSHDNSPTHSSIIEVLESAGLLTNVNRMLAGDGSFTLEPVEDPTGVRIYGMPGLREGREREYYNVLDRADVERGEGRKIFVFHSAISELLSGRFSKMESVNLSLFPKGFDYYAGGHVHQRLLKRLEEYGLFAYPGPLFAGWGIEDLVDYSKQGGGFYLVKMGSSVEAEFVGERPIEVEIVERSADGLSSQEFLKALEPDRDFSNKVAVVRLKGKLSSGRVADISSEYVRSIYARAGALDVIINRSDLSGPEHKLIRVGSVAQLEDELIKENVKGSVDPSFARSLLDILSAEKLEGETDSDYEERVIREAMSLLEGKLRRGKRVDARSA